MGTIKGKPGNDVLVGTKRNDFIYGYNGDDTLSGRDGDDYFFGGIGNDKLYGENGRDWLGGEAGDDLLDGAAGDDQLRGGDGADILRGGTDNDLLVGDAGDDVLDGGTGDDGLEGRAGNDILTGGDGADTFTFGETDGVDLISDYNPAEGDAIWFGSWTHDSNPSIDGQQNWDFVGSAYTGAPLANGNGQATISYDAGVTTLTLYDYDGDALADFTVKLSGSHGEIQMLGFVEGPPGEPGFFSVPLINYPETLV